MASHWYLLVSNEYPKSKMPRMGSGVGNTLQLRLIRLKTSVLYTYTESLDMSRSSIQDRLDRQLAYVPLHTLARKCRSNTEPGTVQPYSDIVECAIQLTFMISTWTFRVFSC
jgi:hypothetical protein